MKHLVCQRVIANRELVRNRQRELAGLNPIFLVKRGLAMIPQLMKRLERQIIVMSERRRRQIAAAASQLTQLSPLAILGRGYSILTKVRDGGILRRADDAQPGEEIVARLSQGQLGCTVKRVLPDPSV
jgi:exodeoxyribonuclease VII large subunit